MRTDWSVAILLVGAAAIVYRVLRARLAVRWPVPGELWISETTGPVWVQDVFVPLLGWGTTITYYPAMTAGSWTLVTSFSAWRRSGFKPVPRLEWDDYLKHGRMP